jgi:dTDP-4-dehydrorhamnose 3,5-epimerase
MIEAVLPTALPGCFRLRLKPYTDARGRFVKTFQVSAFRQHGLAADFREDFYTVSGPGVLRGMHFQVPPADLTKTVGCLAGAVLDAVLDLRAGSPAYGRHETLRLDADRPELIYIPPGVAHGFLVLEAPAVLCYRQTSEYAPDADRGVRWDSCGIDWGVTAPVVSNRDLALPRLAEFRTPFRYHPPTEGRT